MQEKITLNSHNSRISNHTFNEDKNETVTQRTIFYLKVLGIDQFRSGLKRNLGIY